VSEGVEEEERRGRGRRRVGRGKGRSEANDEVDLKRDCWRIGLRGMGPARILVTWNSFKLLKKDDRGMLWQ
jgi:hypothetical protein